MPAFVEVDARYHECQVLAMRVSDCVVDVRLAVGSAERFVPERAFATGDGWVAGTLSAPLEIRFVYGSPAEATAEGTLFDHWGVSGAMLEITKSVESQGILVVEPSTGLFTGMRLGAAHLDAPIKGVAPRP